MRYTDFLKATIFLAAGEGTALAAVTLAVCAAQDKTGTMLEINAAPDRRDLSDNHARAAAEAGVMIVIDSDAHSTKTLEFIEYGVATGRRAWLTSGQVANTRPWKELDKLRKRRR